MACSTAFLAVSLPNGLKASLQEVASAIEASPEKLLGVEDVGFTPHGEDKLHMTFVFCGNALQKLPKADLAALYGEVQDVVTTAVQAGQLEFNCFELFPPDKQNLIIARFNAPLQLQELRDASWRICLKYGVAVKDDADWMAHVTLGKIRATKAQVGWVSCNAVAGPTFPAGSLKPVGLTLLGARPKQAWLDWDEALLFVAANADDASNAAGDLATDVNTAADADSELPRASACVSCIVDYVWLNTALREEVSTSDAECLLAAVEVSLGEPDDSLADFEEALASAVKVIRDGGAPLCAGSLHNHCKVP